MLNVQTETGQWLDLKDVALVCCQTR